MPPKQRGEELKKIVKSVRDETFEYDGKEPVKTDWAQYDQAQVYEILNYRNYSGMLIGRSIAILYFLARKITAEGAEER